MCGLSGRQGRKRDISFVPATGTEGVAGRSWQKSQWPPFRVAIVLVQLAGKRAGSVVMTTFTMYVTVIKFFLSRCTYFDDFNIKSQILTCKRVITINDYNVIFY